MAHIPHVRLITPIVTRGFRDAASLAWLSGFGARVTQTGITAGPASIESAYEAALAAPGAIAMARAAEEEGADAAVIDCMLDPGLAGARECCAIPVVGAAQSAMHAAAMLGHRFGILAVTERLRGPFRELANVYGLGERLASVRGIGVPVLELARDRPATLRALADAARRSVADDGADVIVLGCTGLVGWAEEVQRELAGSGSGVPVVDPVASAVCLAAAMARLGLRPGAVGGPRLPAGAVTGYEWMGARAPCAAG